MPSNKRKLPSTPSSSDNDEHDRADGRSSPFRTYARGSTKRQRCSTLERGFAHLAINHPIAQTNSYASSYPSPTSSNPSVLDLDLPVARTPSPAPMDSEDTYPIIHPTSIEEPTSPDLSSPPQSENESNDIKMRSQSWYEPEKDRIVITNLDDSDDETDSDAGVNISTALLDRIKDQRVHTSVSIPLPSTSTALVLFQPLTFSPKGKVVDDEPAEVVTPSTLPPDNDAMDIEL